MAVSKEEAEKAKRYVNLPIVGRQPANEKEEKFLRELVEYEFFNTQEPGVFMKFSYGTSKQQERFTLMHGASYLLPRFLARFLESRATPIYKWDADGTGRMVATPTGMDARFRLREVY